MAVAGFYVFNEAVANDAAAVAGKETVTVPNVQGKHKDEAKKLLQDMGLSMGEPSLIQSSKVAPDYVIFQRPAPGEVVRAGRRVYPTVSKGTAYVTVPSVVKLTEAEARDLLTPQLAISQSPARVPSNLPEGTVISQYPPATMEVASNSTVSLLLSEGINRGPRQLVPDFAGLGLAEARKLAAGIGMTLSVVKVETRGAKLNVVLKQLPVAGSELVPGEKVVVDVKTDAEVAEVEHRVELRYLVPQGFVDRHVEIFTVGRDGSKKTAFPKPGDAGKIPPGARVTVFIRYVDQMTVEVYLDGQLVRRYYYEDGKSAPRVTDF